MTNKGTMWLDDKVMVSDPCYDLGTWCQGVIENVLPGEYDCLVKYVDTDSWGTRVAAIQAVHHDYIDSDLKETMENFEVGVDSGMAGIFDYKHYARHHTGDECDEPWYNRCCNATYTRTRNPEYERFEWDVEGETVVEMMRRHREYQKSMKSLLYLEKLDANVVYGSSFVSSSGYGDGGYCCWTAKNEDGNVVSIRIEFIGEEDEE